MDVTNYYAIKKLLHIENLLWKIEAKLDMMLALNMHDTRCEKLLDGALRCENLIKVFGDQSTHTVNTVSQDVVNKRVEYINKYHKWD